MKRVENSLTLKEVLNNYMNGGPFDVVGIFPVGKQVIVYLKNGRGIYIINDIDIQRAASDLDEQVKALDGRYKGSVNFHPLELLWEKKVKVRDTDDAMDYYNQFCRKTINERIEK